MCPGLDLSISNDIPWVYVKISIEYTGLQVQTNINKKGSQQVKRYSSTSLLFLVFRSWYLKIELGKEDEHKIKVKMLEAGRFSLIGFGL